MLRLTLFPEWRSACNLARPLAMACLAWIHPEAADGNIQPAGFLQFSPGPPVYCCLRSMIPRIVEQN
jgi:hypothetical protein